MTTRRALIVTLFQAAVIPAENDPWRELADAWNPFAQKMNQGVLDLKLWRKVVAVVERIERKKGKPS